MKTKIIILILVLSGFFPQTMVSAQSNPGKVIEEMQKFNWMLGDWKGDAWYMGRDQSKTQLTQQEHIITRLDGGIIIIEGKGYNPQVNSQESKILFQAFGILTYDQVNSKFVIRAYQGGYFIDSDVVFNENGSYSWGMEMPYGTTRYTFRLTEDGKWNEVGEFLRAGGSAWVQTFEMTLTKLN